MQRTETGNSNFGALVLMVLLFLLAYFLPASTTRTAAVATHSPASMVVSTVPVKAISAEAIVLPSAQNSCLTLVAKPVYNLYSNTLRVVNDNLHVTNQLAVLKKECRQRSAQPLLPLITCLPVDYASEDPSMLG